MNSKLQTINSKPTYIDINCDVGEGVQNESALFPYISSCSVACGGHAGDAEAIKKTVLLANEHNVRIGAHPSYPDKKNFGRKMMDISIEKLKASISSQLELFLNVVAKEKIRMHHIKPHGALYNAVAANRTLAVAFLDAVEIYRAEAILYVPPQSHIANEANRRGFRVKHEAFGDRNYNDDLTLVSRHNPKAVIERPIVVLQHMQHIIAEQKVKTLSGKQLPLTAQTFCIHGDNPKALQILMYLTEQLPKADIHLKK
ncbi:5-oxoprolinase subunit PxpA [Allomuricauda sp. d1]|uniref:5-oxoprolinase subunit PxpA n=1 Tax=Allomuricauda sp. d1 TaxID=3136725 RepID=UPI0031DC467E